MRHKKGEVIQIMEITGNILSAKTYQRLMKNVRNSLSHFFGFHSVSLLLKDDKRDTLLGCTKEDPPALFDRDEEFLLVPTTIGLTGLCY
jgi:hypothetical protein